MKTTFSILLILVVCAVKSQIVLEQAYDTATTNITNYGMNQLMIINFELSGERYVKINRKGKIMEIYDMNHVLLKTIPLPFCL